VHLAAAGHPILGDAYYGRSGYGRSGDSEAGRRHALHAAAIVFRHPVTNAPLRIVAPVPADFWRLLASVPGGGPAPLARPAL
jgi:23S rRNA-/tRNA-specific pseudouridylate synthase